MITSYRFGRFELRLQTRELLADGAEVPLGARAFDVLIALLERRERLVTKRELLELVWPGLVVEENNLSVHISALRKALGPKVIATVPGRGYRFIAGLKGEPHPWPNKDGHNASNADNKSLAVLPFTNLSEDRGMTYFADGVHEDLLTQLALLGELKVVSRTSVMEYRDTKKNAHQIGVELGVGSLLEGSVRRAGNRVRVSAQLIDARLDQHLWARSYDRELNDIFAIQTEIATEIARALKISLNRHDHTQLGRKPTENLEAYELFLRHRQLDTQALISATDVLFERRIELLSRAVKLDPKFALAWAKLGVDEARVRFSFGDPFGDRLARAKSALDRALALALDDREVRLQLGYLYYYGDQDFARAAQYVEDLLDLAPNHVEMLTLLSYCSLRLGSWADANALLEKALSIDTRNVTAAVQLRQNLLYFRHFDEALAVQRRLVDVVPENFDQVALLYLIEYFRSGSFARYDAWRVTLTLGETHKFEMIWSNDLFRALAVRDLQTALRLLETAPGQQGAAAVAGWFVDSTRACVLLALGRRAEAFEFAGSKLTEARELSRRAPNDRNLAYNMLVYLAMLGERDAAVAEFRKWRDRCRARSDAHLTQDVMAWRIHVLALLGDREHALEALRALAREPSAWWEYAPIDPALASLWDDLAFLDIVNDPANKAPIPFENRGIPKMPD